MLTSGSVLTPGGHFRPSKVKSILYDRNQQNIENVAAVTSVPYCYANKILIAPVYGINIGGKGGRIVMGNKITQRAMQHYPQQRTSDDDYDNQIAEI